MLTEARVIIPGGQSLLGFQFVYTFTRSFKELPLSIQYLHAAGLCAVALSVLLLMTPAALHRIAFHGEDDASFFKIDANLRFEIQGDDGVLPWIGRKTGRQAVADFIRDIRALTEPITFEAEDILASESRAAIIGALQSRIKATGKIAATQFAIILTTSGDVVTRFQMLEDSFDVSKAARS
jgi:ketosteroid isomerase-like protein